MKFKPCDMWIEQGCVLISDKFSKHCTFFQLFHSWIQFKTMKPLIPCIGLWKVLFFDLIAPKYLVSIFPPQGSAEPCSGKLLVPGGVSNYMGFVFVDTANSGLLVYTTLGWTLAISLGLPACTRPWPNAGLMLHWSNIRHSIVFCQRVHSRT